MWGKAITLLVLQVVVPFGEDFGIAGLQASLAALLIRDRVNLFNPPIFVLRSRQTALIMCEYSKC